MRRLVLETWLAPTLPPSLVAGETGLPLAVNLGRLGGA